MDFRRLTSLKIFSAYVPSLFSLLPKMQAMMVGIKYTVIVRAIEDARITFLTLRPLSRPLLDMLPWNMFHFRAGAFYSTTTLCSHTLLKMSCELTPTV